MSANYFFHFLPTTSKLTTKRNPSTNFFEDGSSQKPILIIINSALAPNH